ncbi:MAG: ABC transporter ATP-binding protein [Chitinophagaceae bacterium]|nr:ABC transporter ATP-binding protein [Chitinophagaceae bacterium]
MNIIEVKNLSKSFGSIQAVNQLSFSVKPGEIYGFLGQNGSGKSTTIRMLLSLVMPDTGDIEIFGLSLQKHRNEILKNTGALIERPDLYKYLNAFENLEIFARLSGKKKSRKQMMELLEKVGLAGRAQSKVKTYSQGMKQRLGLACALVHDPQLIILDEPMNGLDPQGITDMRELIIQLSRKEQKTVFISSHLLSEMQQIADSLLIIHKGKKITEGNLNELMNPEKVRVELITTDMPKTAHWITRSAWAGSVVEATQEAICLLLQKEQLPQLNNDLVSQRFGVVSLRPYLSLEEYFLTQIRE